MSGCCWCVPVRVRWPSEPWWAALIVSDAPRFDLRLRICDRRDLVRSNTHSVSPLNNSMSAFSTRCYWSNEIEMRGTIGGIERLKHDDQIDIGMMRAFATYERPRYKQRSAFRYRSARMAAAIATISPLFVVGCTASPTAAATQDATCQRLYAVFRECHRTRALASCSLMNGSLPSM